MTPRVRWTRGELSLLVKRCLELSPHLAWLPSKELVKLLAQAQDCLPENRQQVRIRALSSTFLKELQAALKERLTHSFAASTTLGDVLVCARSGAGSLSSADDEADYLEFVDAEHKVCLRKKPDETHASFLHKVVKLQNVLKGLERHLRAKEYREQSCGSPST